MGLPAGGSGRPGGLLHLLAHPRSRTLAAQCVSEARPLGRLVHTCRPFQNQPARSSTVQPLLITSRAAGAPGDRSARVSCSILFQQDHPLCFTVRPGLQTVEIDSRSHGDTAAVLPVPFCNPLSRRLDLATDQRPHQMPPHIVHRQPHRPQLPADRYRMVVLGLKGFGLLAPSLYSDGISCVRLSAAVSVGLTTSPLSTHSG